MRQYPEYTESGAREVGSIPAHWQCVPLKYGFRVVGGSTPSSGEPRFWDGAVVWVTPADLSRLHSREVTSSTRKVSEEGVASCGTTVVPADSLILSTRAPIGSLGVAGVDLCTNQGCKALVPSAKVDTTFYFYYLSVSTKALNVRGRGTTFLELSGDALASFPMPLPPLAEQHAISAFLDRETGKIDALVEEQRRLIALLKEKRQAVISHAVTKGLDPVATLKPSGIDWLGDIPAHWEVTQLKRLTQDGTSITYGIVQAGPMLKEGIPYIRTGDMSGDVLPSAGYPLTSPEIEAAFERSRVFPGDLVVAIRATIGKVLPVPSDLPMANLTQGTAKFSPGDGVLRDFIKHAISADCSQYYFSLHAKGATFKEITLDALRRLPVVLPPLAEQQEIAAFLEAEQMRFTTLTAEATRAITLLRERRAALISAAVTGKIDVRDALSNEEEAA